MCVGQPVARILDNLMNNGAVPCCQLPQRTWRYDVIVGTPERKYGQIGIAQRQMFALHGVVQNAPQAGEYGGDKAAKFQLHFLTVKNVSAGAGGSTLGADATTQL